MGVSSNPFLAVLQLGVVFWFVAGTTLLVVFGYLMPWSVFQMARHTRRIHEQLERLNDILESGRQGAGPLKL